MPLQILDDGVARALNNAERLELSRAVFGLPQLVPHSTVVPLDGRYLMAQHAITGALTLTAGALTAGGSCTLRLVANGVNVPTLPGTKFGPGTFDNTSGRLNLIDLWTDGAGVYHAISNLAAANFGTIHNVHKIAPMTAAIQQASTQRVALAFHGHSIVKGLGSNGTATEGVADAQAWRTGSIGPRIAQALSQAKGGSAGLGVEVPSVGQALQFAIGGAASISPIYAPGGAHGRVWNLSAATDWLQFTAQGSAVRIFGYALLAGVAARYQVNGGAVQTAPAAGSELTGTGNAVWYEFTISGLTAGDTVRVLGPTSSGVRVSGVDFDHKSGAGVTVHRIAEGDKMGPQIVAEYLDSTDTQPAGGWVQADPAGSNTRKAQTDSVTVRLGVAGVLNMFDVNDIKGYNYAGQAWGWTLPTLERHLKNYLSAMAARNLCVLLVLGPYRNPDIASTAGTPYTQQDIIDLYKSVSDWSTNCAYIDLTDEFQSPGSTLHSRYAYQQSLGYHFDGVHPNAVGAEHYAQRIAQALIR